MKYSIIAVTVSLLFSTAWADEVDCEKTPYYGVCPNCEPSASGGDGTAADSPMTNAKATAEIGRLEWANLPDQAYVGTSYSEHIASPGRSDSTGRSR
ncbi:MAG TPA: hypothetical protein VEP67_01315 [Thiobacillaceae bacterium]|nr:hypothetical protein [Thiobacillaceae bacterium]